VLAKEADAPMERNHRSRQKRSQPAAAEGLGYYERRRCCEESNHATMWSPSGANGEAGSERRSELHYSVPRDRSLELGLAEVIDWVDQHAPEHARARARQRSANGTAFLNRLR
jgi:hypothetical protein